MKKSHRIDCLMDPHSRWVWICEGCGARIEVVEGVKKK